MVTPRLIGMVHLGPLPGSPQFSGSFDAVIEAAVQDATVLAESGFDALMVENFGDAPFFATSVPAVTIAAMTAATRTIQSATPLPVGVNVLRNDAIGALGVASATGAAFIRVNVLAGVMYTDQGAIEGRSADVARTRSAWCPEVEVWADVMVKHATAPPGLRIEDAAADLAERGGADAVIVSGVSTGSAVDLHELGKVREAIGNTRLVIGSGADEGSIGALLAVADSAICGTATKLDGVTTNPVDPARAAALVNAAD